MTRSGAAALSFWALVLAGCGGERGDTAGGDGAPVNATCDVVRSGVSLPDGLDESSGLALGGSGDLLWTHNDSGNEPVLYAIGLDGSRMGAVRVSNARNTDWEDIAAGPCEGGRCLYIGDFGDNRGRRDDAAILRIPEPAPDAADVRAERIAFSYPGGPRDAEALFVLPDGSMHIVTKGRNSNVAVYRLPDGAGTDAPVELTHLIDLSAEEVPVSDQVTGADASADGEWVAVRTYRSLDLYRTDDLLSGGEAFTRIDLTPIAEPQGEAVAFLEGDGIALSSEASGLQTVGSLAELRCGV